MRLRALIIPVLFAFGALAALGAAAAELSPPAPGVDGVWRTSSNWTVESGDHLRYENITIEVGGSLLVQAGGSLVMSNVSIVFPSSGAAAGRVNVADEAVLGLLNVSGRFNGTADTLDVSGRMDAVGCDLAFASTSASPESLRFVGADVHLTDCWITTDAVVSMSANNSAVHTLDCDFVTSAGAGADVRLGAPGTYVLDTTRFGALLGSASPHVTLYSTVRFMLRTAEGNISSGLVNGTGPGAEIFQVEVNGTGTSGAVRLLWLDLNPAPPRLDAAQRVSRSSVQFTAVGPGGGNTSDFLIGAHRVNHTVALDRVFDVSVALLGVDGHLAQGPRLKEAFYVDLNASFTVRVTVHNDGTGTSPALNLTVTQFGLEPSSFARLYSRPRPTVAVPALAKGEAAEVTFTATADEYGGQVLKQTACFYSVTYTSAYRVEYVDTDDQDYGPWNDGREVATVAFFVRGNETAPCAAAGGPPIELIAAGGLGAIVAVAALTHFASAAREERRAASRDAAKPAPPAEDNKKGAPPRD